MTDSALNDLAALADELADAAVIARAVNRFGKPDARERTLARVLALTDAVETIAGRLRGEQAEEIAA